VNNIENVYNNKYLAKQEYLKYTNIYVQYNGIVYNENNGTVFTSAFRQDPDKFYGYRYW